MTLGTFAFLWGVIGVVIGLGIGSFARTRGRSFWPWAVLGTLSWLVALIALVLLPPRVRHVVACEACGAEHRPGALTCSACGRTLAWD
jgi:hypothetical protein